MTCVQSEVLQTVVDEFTNLSRETTNVFIFDENGEITVANQATTEDQAKLFIDDFFNLNLQTDVLGGLENLAIQGAHSQIQIARIENLYLSTVSSRKVDLKILNSLTRVLIPTIVRMLDQQLVTEGEEVSQELQVLPEEETQVEESIVSEEEPEVDAVFDQESTLEPLLPEAPINQLMVEKIKGILVHADTVRVDNEVIAKWIELYGEKELLVHIQTLEGRETTCKFKPLKDAKSNAKGIIQIPEKILETLHASKGQLVMVSPEIS